MFLLSIVYTLQNLKKDKALLKINFTKTLIWSNVGKNSMLYLQDTKYVSAKYCTNRVKGLLCTLLACASSENKYIIYSII